jgi:hypothetical protein
VVVNTIRFVVPASAADLPCCCGVVEDRLEGVVSEADIAEDIVVCKRKKEYK